MHNTPDARVNSQHTKLCEMLTEMCEMITDSDTEYTLIPKFAKFVMYLEHHFEYEESAMRASNYFDVEAHTAAHAQFKVTVTKIYRNAMYNTASLKDNLPTIARALKTHIETEEKIFSTELLPSFYSKSTYAEFS